MENYRLVTIIDAGNTSIKVARFEDKTLLSVDRFSSSEPVNSWTKKISKKGDFAISSVLSEEKTQEIIAHFDDIMVLTPQTPVPINVNYGTTNTLGMDRLCNAVYLHSVITSEYAVCIDLGTCFKFDILHKSEGYMGGSISPGIRLRYQSLNDYTGKLPLLTNKSVIDFVGIDTETSIQSGVMNGAKAEVMGFIAYYREQYPGLTFFMTGGDLKHFDIHPKNDIFADENLTLKGLHEIYRHNA